MQRLIYQEIHYNSAGKIQILPKYPTNEYQFNLPISYNTLQVIPLNTVFTSNL